jgi:hypothetical protein
MSRSIHDEEILHDDEPPHDADAAISAFSKKTMTMLIVVVLVVGGVAGTIILFSVDEGGAQSVTLTGPSQTDDLLTFAYTIRTDRAPATGPTTLTIMYDGATVHSRTFPAAGGGGRIDVHLVEFAVGNGDYLFKLQYKDKTGTSTFTIGTPDTTNFLVTAIGAPSVPPGAQAATTVYGAVEAGDPHIGVIAYSVYFFSDITANLQTKAPPGSMLAMQVSKNGVAIDNVLNVSVEGKLFYTHNFTVGSAGPGNYTVDATFTNQWVKLDSPIKTLTLSNKTFVQNKPYACVVGSPYHGNNANSFTITADASCSHDDLAITQYTWSFGDGTPPVTNGAIPTETHTFPSSAVLRTYTGSVCAYDANSDGPDCVDFTVTTSTN